MKMLRVLSVFVVILIQIQQASCEECYEDTICSSILGCSPLYQERLQNASIR